MLKAAVAIPAIVLCTLMMLAVLPAGSFAKGGGGCANSDSPTSSLKRSSARAAITCLFNKERSAQDVEQNSKLERAAQRHTNTMRSKDCFKHECPGEPSFEERIGSTGYCGAVGCAASEVIAILGPRSTPQEVVASWMDSGEHRAIIRRGSFDDVGIGIDGNSQNVLYTAVLGHN
jgi:uncharacterized protein YkwD